MKEQDREQLEAELSRTLEEGEFAREEPERTARRRLGAKYEVRIMAKRDPIVQETEQYRQLAKEVDDRYDRYIERARASRPDESSDGE